MNKILLVILLLSSEFLMAQTDDYYYEIPDYPAAYTATTVVARMVDGLGFRYYWATKDLRAEDLAFKPSDEARTCEETINHILGLTDVVLNSVKNLPNTGQNLTEGMSFAEKRAETLARIKEASEILKQADANALDQYQIVFQRSTGSSEFPFWNQINGPISDALWHVGQVVTFRRSSGNPINSKASFLSGKVRE